MANKLEAAGYEVTRQEFEFPYFDVLSESFSQTAPQERDFEPYDGWTGDYDVMTYSGSGRVEDALVVPTNDVVIPPSPEPSSDSGCEPEDFVDVTTEAEPRVALIQRGGCDFVVKAQNAEAKRLRRGDRLQRGPSGRPGRRSRRGRAWHPGRAGRSYPGDRHKLRAGRRTSTRTTETTKRCG